MFGCDAVVEKAEVPEESVGVHTSELDQGKTIAEPEFEAKTRGEIDKAEETVEAEEAEQVYLPLEMNIMHHTAPLFPVPLDADLTKEHFAVLAYYGEDAQFRKRYSTHEWITVEDDQGMNYIPSWYWTAASSNSEVIAPIELMADTEAAFHLYPESLSNWSYEEIGQLSIADGGDLSSDPLVALFRYEEWYGVMFLPFPKHDEYKMFQSVLLWLHKSDIQTFGEQYDDFFSPKTALPVETLRGITEIMLHTGTSREEVKDLLGEPHFLESSRGLNYSGEPLRAGEDWRYELP